MIGRGEFAADRACSAFFNPQVIGPGDLVGHRKNKAPMKDVRRGYVMVNRAEWSSPGPYAAATAANESSSFPDRRESQRRYFQASVALRDYPEQRGLFKQKMRTGGAA